MIGLILGNQYGASPSIETVFTIPAWTPDDDSIFRGNYPVIQGCPSLRRHVLCDRPTRLSISSTLILIRAWWPNETRFPQWLDRSIHIAFLLIVAALSLLWTPFDPMKLALPRGLRQPGPLHLLGTDEFGRDVLSRLMDGARGKRLDRLPHGWLRVIAGTLIVCEALCPRLDRWPEHGSQQCPAGFPRHLAGAWPLAVFGANQYGIIFALGIAYTPSMHVCARGRIVAARAGIRRSVAVMGNGEIFTMFRHSCPTASHRSPCCHLDVSAGPFFRKSALSFLASACHRRHHPGATCWQQAVPSSSRPSVLGLFPRPLHRPSHCLASTFLVSTARQTRPPHERF